jgi:hypothetical protein
MMFILCAAFAAIAVGGFITGHIGVSLIALFMIAFTGWGCRHLDRLDADWANDPRRAKTEDDVLVALDQHASESSKDRI